jgi:glucokinase
MLFAIFSSFCLQSNIVSFILQVLSFRREGEETMEKTCIGIDIGGTSVKLGLFTESGELLYKWEVPTRTEDGGKFILPDVAASIKAVLEERGIDRNDIAGAGMGVPGPVMPDGYVEVCVNLGWRDLNPQKELSRLLDGLFVVSGNDANVAALGEMWQGGGKGYTDIVMVTLGTGVGGGVIIGEKIIAGKHGLGGEIGHIHVRDEEWEHCNCGGVGCVEQIASATGIAREARRKMAASSNPSSMRRYGEAITAKDVLDEAKAGDEMALEVVELVGRYLGLMMAQVAMTVDPEMFVIGGGVSRAGQFLLDRIEKYYDHYSPISKNKGKVGLAKLGNDAGIYGAARLVLG